MRGRKRILSPTTYAIERYDTARRTQTVDKALSTARQALENAGLDKAKIKETMRVLEKLARSKKK